MNILFTICARSGSKGVKNKNIREFNGYPLLYYTLAVYQLFAEKYKCLFNTIDLALNTDSLKLLEQMNKIQIEYKYIERTYELAGDTVSKTDVIKDTVIKTEKINKCIYDIVVDLDLTSPIRTVRDVNGVVSALIEDKLADVAFSVTNSRRTPYFNMVNKKEDGYFGTVIKSDFIARQQAPACYDMNASIYAYRREFILDKNTKKVFDGRSLVWEMMDTGVLDIDNEEDLEFMELIGKHIFEKYDVYKDMQNKIKMLFD